MKFFDKLKNFFTSTAEGIFSYSRIGGAPFFKDIYDERIMDIHEEMREAKRAFNTNSYVYAAVMTLRDFILGASQKIKAQSPETEDFLNSFLRESDFWQILPELIENLIVTGNAYLEVIRDSRGRPVKLRVLPDSSRVYINATPEGEVINYIIEVPMFYKLDGAEWHTIYYNTKMPRKVYGFTVPKERIIHFKLGISDHPLYGRGMVAPILNDLKILNELEKDVALISRYKVLPKKWINIPGATQEKLEKLVSYISQLADDENIFTAEPELEIKDLSYSGQHVDIQNYLEYFKKKLTVALAPSFMIFGGETNRATSREQLNAYFLRVKTIRDIISKTLEKKLLRSIILAYNLDGRGVVFRFTDYEYRNESEERLELLRLYNYGVITLNELRKAIGLQEVEDGDSFIWNRKENARAYQSNPYDQALKKPMTLHVRDNEKDKPDD